MTVTYYNLNFPPAFVMDLTVDVKNITFDHQDKILMFELKKKIKN